MCTDIVRVCSPMFIEMCGTDARAWTRRTSTRIGVCLGMCVAVSRGGRPSSACSDRAAPSACSDQPSPSAAADRPSYASSLRGHAACIASGRESSSTHGPGRGTGVPSVQTEPGTCAFHVGVCVDMFVDMCLRMCVGYVCRHLWTCVSTFLYVCVDMFLDVYRHVARHVYRHVYRHVIDMWIDMWIDMLWTCGWTCG